MSGERAEAEEEEKKETPSMIIDRRQDSKVNASNDVEIIVNRVKKKENEMQGKTSAKEQFEKIVLVEFEEITKEDNYRLTYCLSRRCLFV